MGDDPSAVATSLTGSDCVTSVFSFSGSMIPSISDVSGTSGCAAITAGGFGGAGASSAGSLCGHTAAHKAR